jgi:hypothetical protein
MELMLVEGAAWRQRRNVELTEVAAAGAKVRRRVAFDEVAVTISGKPHRLWRR